MFEEIKKLFPEVELQEDTILKLKVLLDNRIQEEKDKIVSEKDAEIESIKESAREYGEYAKTQYEELKEQVNSYSEYVQEETALLSEQANAYGEEVREETIKELSEQIESYAFHVVEEFAAENRQALIETTEYARLKDAFKAITGVLGEQSIHFTENDGIEDLKAQLEENKKETNRLLGMLSESQNSIATMKRSAMFEKMTNDLTDTQRERVQNLLEGMSFKTDESYEQSLKTFITEITKPGEKPTVINEEEKHTPAINDRMQKYLNRL